MAIELIGCKECVIFDLNTIAKPGKTYKVRITSKRDCPSAHYDVYEG